MGTATPTVTTLRRHSGAVNSSPFPFPPHLSSSRQPPQSRPSSTTGNQLRERVWSLARPRACGPVLGRLGEAPGLHGICPGSPSRPSPVLRRAPGDKVGLSAQARAAEGGFVYCFASAGFSVPEVKTCWLPMFPAQGWGDTSPSHPTLDPLHARHKFSLRTPSPATGNQTRELPGPLGSSSEKLAPAGNWLGPGHPPAPAEGAADHTLVSFRKHSRDPVLRSAARQLDLQRDAFSVSASAHCWGSGS